jgi:hypothetical protein
MTDQNLPRDPDQPQQGEETLPDLFEVRITVSQQDFAGLMERFPLDLGCRPHIDMNPDGTGTLQAFASRERIRELEAAGYRVEQGENVSALGRERQQEVGTGDRFQGGRVTPHGLGRKPGRREGGPR